MSAAPTPVRPCPTCGRAAKLSPDNPHRPFCSERCRLIDLGEWVAGRRGLPVEGDGADDSDPDAPRPRHDG